MSGGALGLIELLLVFGVVIGWGVRELVLLERAKRARRDAAPPPGDGARAPAAAPPPDAGP
ncbi:hypothetical protein [Piscinibacter sakaiensis]|uniref:Uncharacterized protein n=1 Tax=Piscinibacter sakaiensis TaxID=1547922 RepID=A0A0K8NVU7_PISS1|nr:hypothetical protein [Piscinibacter sakaiensis]GAP34404.1 hypothetical protein ISF6_4579 [Piscinibacter sakaiensis]